MPRQRGIRRIAAEVAKIRTGDAEVDRAAEPVVERLNQLARSPFSQAIPITLRLAAGLNKVPHGMRAPIRSFLWSADRPVTIHSRQKENPAPERTFWVEVSGSDPVEATLFLLPSLPVAR